MPLAANAVLGDITGDTNRRCKTDSNPSSTVVTCFDFGLTKEGRLNGCAADAQCISSSAVQNPSKFSPPWSPSDVSPEAKDIPRAWRALVSAIEDQEGLQIVERRDEDKYLRATAVSEVPKEGVDDVEFRLLEETPPLALFRSATRQSLYVYPLQQPVPNQKSHADRLQQIRTRLGWEELGLAGDAALERDMAGAQVRNVFGLNFGGVKIPEEYE